MATEKTKKAAAGKKKATLTVAEVIVARQKEILSDWVDNIKSLAGTRTLELMTDEQLYTQADGLLRALTKAFGTEQYVDIDTVAKNSNLC